PVEGTDDSWQQKKEPQQKFSDKAAPHVPLGQRDGPAVGAVFRLFRHTNAPFGIFAQRFFASREAARISAFTIATYNRAHD
ncbi:MAG: hypothetical protein WCC59_07840, partial [Terriglobales bacterium]